VEKHTKKGMSQEDAIFTVIKRYIQESKKIRFEGNSYSEAWVKEAAKRGLSNHGSTPEALEAFISKKTIDLFENHNVMTEVELRSRYEIKMEKYIKKIQIESRVMGDLATNHILPTAILYQNRLIDNARGLKEVIDSKSYVKLSKNQTNAIKYISNHISAIKENVEAMIEARKRANKIKDIKEKAIAYRDDVMIYFDSIRYHVDKLEFMIDDELWPLPKYRELLFIR
jgi:glutamine synthetase